MKHLKLLEHFGEDLDYKDKFEIMLDSIVEVMDKFGFTYYDEDEDDGDIDLMNQPYYDLSYNWSLVKQFVVGRIDICNISQSGFTTEEVIHSLEQIKPKLELRSGLKLKIISFEGDNSQISIITL